MADEREERQARRVGGDHEGDVGGHEHHEPRGEAAVQAHGDVGPEPVQAPQPRR
jgi:hypothetical protein